jgi:hypothetical protein
MYNGLVNRLVNILQLLTWVNFHGELAKVQIPKTRMEFLPDTQKYWEHLKFILWVLEYIQNFNPICGQVSDF